MHRALWAATGGLFLLTSLACGGGGPASTYGSVAYSEWSDGFNFLEFQTDSKLRLTWQSMSGEAVTGTFVEKGDEVELTFDPSDNWGGQSAKMKRTGMCSMAWYEWVDEDGVLHDDDSDIYERRVPKCP